jgi:nucleoside-diphosphate-sugar epimerase
MIDYFEEDLNLVFDNTKDFWKEINNKTIFITGGTGFFGIWFQMSFIFINRKLNLNSNLIVLTRSKKKFLEKNPWINQYDEISFKEGDVTDFDFFDENVDYIIHAATDAKNSQNLEQALTTFNTVVNGTKRVLDFATLKKVNGFLLTSSGAVYGPLPISLDQVSEDYIGGPRTIHPDSIYGEAKRMAEVLCSSYYKFNKIPVKIARCFAFIGPFLPLNAHFAAGNFIQSVLSKKDIIIKGNGTPLRSYMYSSDLMIWLWTILFKGEENQAYNVGSDESISVFDLAVLISNLNGESRMKILVQEGLPEQQFNVYVPDISKAKLDLNLALLVSIEDSIYKTLKFNNSLF